MLLIVLLFIRISDAGLDACLYTPFFCVRLFNFERLVFTQFVNGTQDKKCNR